MIVEEDDEDIVEIGTAQGFTQLVEPKKEKGTHPPSHHMPPKAMGWGEGHHEVSLHGEVAEGMCLYSPSWKT